MRRRDCLLLGAQAGALAGCGRAARLLEPDPPPLLDAPASRSLGRLLLDRAAFGPRPAGIKNPCAFYLRNGLGSELRGG